MDWILFLGVKGGLNQKERRTEGISGSGFIPLFQKTQKGLKKKKIFQMYYISIITLTCVKQHFLVFLLKNPPFSD